MQRLRIVLILLGLVVVACKTAVIGTPTPFPTEAAVTPLAVANSQAIPLEIADLVATPEASQNTFIRLTGQYYRRPKLICDTDPHPAPATWELISGEAVALAGGFDGELRRLLPDGLTMTVEGHWLLWRGPVGCGKRAKVQDIWYLQVSHIVDPSPIAQVTLTPFMEGVEVAAVITAEVGITLTEPVTVTIPIPTLLPEPSVTPTLPSEGEIPSATPTLELAEPTQLPDIEPTEVLTLTIEPNGDEPPSDSEATATPEREDETGEPTATLAPGAPTNTPTPSATPDPNTTATPTLMPGETRLTIQEELDAMSLSKNVLGQNEIHAWPFIVEANEVVTITAVTTTDTTLLISIVDEDGISLVDADANGGEVATIEQFDLPIPGSYQIYVQTEDGIPAEYALMLLFSDSLNFIFQPVIGYGASETGNLPANSEHFWHFAGKTGDRITVTAAPDANTDVFLELYGPDADRISPPFISVGGNGVAERLEFSLPQDGLYSIRVGEWVFEAGSYQLQLIKN